jgi:superfamily I DNA/RNA helicase
MPHAQGDVAEEKRIFYVACSRAAEKLEISWSGPRSRFIPEHYEEVRDGLRPNTEGL